MSEVYHQPLACEHSLAEDGSKPQETELSENEAESIESPETACPPMPPSLPLPPPPAMDQRSTKELIANFRPVTHREVIYGIAPHVFDERKRRRGQKRGSRSYDSRWYYQNGDRRRSSPLVGATVISWDDNLIYLESSDPRASVDVKHTSGPSAGADATAITGDMEDSSDVASLKSMQSTRGRRWKRFRIPSLKSIIVKLK